MDENKRKFLKKLGLSAFVSGLFAASLKNATANISTDQLLLNTARSIPVSHSPAPSATEDLDLSQGTIHDITMPAGNITLTVSNEQDGHIFTVRILQDGTGSRTVTWFSSIKWAGGSAPTLTTTGGKADMFIFRCTGADSYDGFIVGQNI